MLTREQFDRDPRRAWMVTTVIAAALLALLFIAILAFDGGDNSPPDTQPGVSNAGSASNATQPAGVASSATGADGTATPPPTPTPEPIAGTPYGESGMTAALQARGLSPAPLDAQFTCQNAGTTPRIFSVAAAGGEQQFVLLVYEDQSALTADWIIGGGRPQYRNGSCAEDAGVIYFNQNLLLILPQTTSAGLQSQIVDAFLTLP